LRIRIAGTRACIAGLAPSACDGAATRTVTIKMRGQDKTMTGLDDLTLWSLPQSYFHATTAYDILRRNGVEVGKMDLMSP